ncbi:MAG: FecR domain-containing protein [Chthoniobacterales bacterium]
MRRLYAGAIVALLFVAQSAFAQNSATITSKDNVVDVASGANGWSAAAAGQSLKAGDRLRTGEDSRAIVRMADGSVLQLDELTTIEIKLASDSGAGQTIRLPAGAAYFLNRGHGGRELRFETPSANGAIRGTALLIKVNPSTGNTGVSMLEGAFELSNAGGRVVASKGEQAGVSPMGSPAKEQLDELGQVAPWYLVIEHDLPTLKSLRQTNQGEFLGAFPTAIKQWRLVSPQLSGSATTVRREWAHQILRSAFKAVGPDCPLRARILRAIIAADPAEASALMQLALELGPNCADAFKLEGAGGSGGGGGDAGEGGFDSNGVPGTPGGPPLLTGGGAQANVVSVCHKGRTIFVSPAGAQAHLNNHPGDTLGPCQVTPTTNR